ncbi:MAG: hypothetical protein ACREBH_00435 [Candidatus Micrarchaeaceae archaeon]
MAIRNLDVKIRYAYARLKRKMALYFTLWFLALLAGVSLIIDSIFINSSATPLKLWSIILVVLLSAKLAYDTAEKMKTEYNQFKHENKQTDNSLRSV